ncbi:putative serine/threonine protein kinase [Lentinula aff. detonsa]|uniref:Serine/threonine protein kinase n=1 Tax=Lentinula aff. detonsa TaxID=2804958 RepID=A0AA38NSZ2_9AGAR|nr:putative serine/threonine protein kinase [Lentinula aff. detonsa]
MQLLPPSARDKPRPSPNKSPATPSSTAEVPSLNTSSSTSKEATTPVSRGQIHVKLIQARGLNVRSMAAQPYVVVQFEQNEFVSRNPTDETDKEVKGTATNLSLSRPTSSNAVNALAAVDAAVKRRSGGSKDNSPVSSVGSKSSTLSAGLFGRLSAHNPVWKHEVSFDVTNSNSLITFNVYDRAVEDQGFLGTLQIKPILVHDHTVDQWYKLNPYENDTNEPVTGEMRVQITFEQYKTKRALGPRDFEFLKLIGRGTFGKVFQVRKRDTKRIYAMKVLSKKEIVAKKEVAHTIGERQILQRSLESPFLVGLKFSFQTARDLYLVTDFKSGGELFWHLQRETRFSEERARFYVAELILALEHLHKYDIVYRDLKPENILLDATGHVALCDFGLSKANLRADELTTTFCGTTEYLAPEILLDEHGYSKIVDFWSLGVLLFEMCCGWSPFYAEDTQQMYKNICFGKIRFPKGVINEDGKQFVKELLNRNPKKRLGAIRDAAELKEHPFFKSIDFNLLAQKKVTPPFKPVVESDESTSNFDPEFTEKSITDVGLNEDDYADFAEDDPSESWVSQSLGTSSLPGGHMHNGPLGSEKTGKTPPMTPISPMTTMTLPNGTAHSTHKTAKHKSSRGGGGLSRNGSGASTKSNRSSKSSLNRAKRQPAGTPLTNSVQENFRGFTYSGGESVSAHADAFASRKIEDDDDDEDYVDVDDEVGGGTEDEFEDFGKSAGRYANMRKKGMGFTDLDDMS